MHFWIDKRQPQYGRRRPGNLYVGGGGTGNALSALYHHKRFGTPGVGVPSTSSRHSSGAGPSNSFTSTPPSIHRFERNVPSGGSAEAQNAEDGLNSSGAGLTRSASNPPASHRRSRSRSHSRERTHRGSSRSRRLNLSNNSSDMSTAEQTSSTQSEPTPNDSKWLGTKRIGLTLCFMACILLGTVAAKFIIEGPVLIDTSRTKDGAEATAYFFIMELIFVATALMLFFSGVACLKKRTNDYLYNLYRQQITSTSDVETIHNTDSPFSSSNNLNYHSESIFFDDDSESQENFLPGTHCHPPLSPCIFHHTSSSSSNGGRSHSGLESGPGRHNLHNFIVYGNPGRSRGCPHLKNMARQNQKPPPYDVALLLPLPNGSNSNSGGCPPNSESGPNRNRIREDKSDVQIDLDGVDILEEAKRKGENPDKVESRCETPPPEYREEFTFKI